MKYHPVTAQIINLLKKGNFWFESFEHKPVKTSEEAVKTRSGYNLHQGAKAIIIKAYPTGKKDKFTMLVFPADLKFDSKKVKDLFDSKKMRFATEEEISNLTDGIKLGAIPPFGNLFNLEVFVDEKLFENEKIVFNAGDQRFSIAMRSVDYKNLVDPKIVTII